jgi:type II secretory pathway pseudopilin PulG
LGGLSLIELLVSVVILSAGSVLAMQALMRVAHAQMVAEYRANAHLLAAAKMAEVELAFLDGHAPNRPDEGSIRLGDQAFEWYLSAMPAPDESGLWSVTLDVGWQHGTHAFERRLATWLRTPDPTP